MSLVMPLLFTYFFLMAVNDSFARSLLTFLFFSFFARHVLIATFAIDLKKSPREWWIAVRPSSPKSLKVRV
jgi:hypothetical protein